MPWQEPLGIASHGAVEIIHEFNWATFEIRRAHWGIRRKCRSSNLSPKDPVVLDLLYKHHIESHRQIAFACNHVSALIQPMTDLTDFQPLAVLSFLLSDR
jgi:hypothetical protein